MRRRVVRAIVAVTAVALALFGLPLAVAVQRVYRDEEVIRLQRVATAATQSISEEPGGADPASCRAPARRGSPSTGRTAGASADRPGARRRGHPAGAGRPGERCIRHGDAHRRRPDRSARARRGRVRAERSDAVVARRVWRTRAAMAAIALAVLALVWGLSLLLARRLVRPIDALADAATRLGEGDFASRASASGVPELDAAAGALNDTAQRLGTMVERERAFSADASISCARR